MYSRPSPPEHRPGEGAPHRGPGAGAPRRPEILALGAHRHEGAVLDADVDVAVRPDRGRPDGPVRVPERQGPQIPAARPTDGQEPAVGRAHVDRAVGRHRRTGDGRGVAVPRVVGPHPLAVGVDPDEPAAGLVAHDAAERCARGELLLAGAEVDLGLPHVPSGGPRDAVLPTAVRRSAAVGRVVAGAVGRAERGSGAVVAQLRARDQVAVAALARVLDAVAAARQRLASRAVARRGVRSRRTGVAGVRPSSGTRPPLRQGRMSGAVLFAGREHARQHGQCHNESCHLHHLTSSCGPGSRRGLPPPYSHDNPEHERSQLPVPLQ